MKIAGNRVMSTLLAAMVGWGAAGCLSARDKHPKSNLAFQLECHRDFDAALGRWDWNAARAALGREAERHIEEKSRWLQLGLAEQIGQALAVLEHAEGEEAVLAARERVDELLGRALGRQAPRRWPEAWRNRLQAELARAGMPKPAGK